MCRNVTVFVMTKKINKRLKKGLLLIRDLFLLSVPFTSYNYLVLDNDTI